MRGGRRERRREVPPHQRATRSGCWTGLHFHLPIGIGASAEMVEPATSVSSGLEVQTATLNTTVRSNKVPGEESDWTDVSINEFQKTVFTRRRLMGMRILLVSPNICSSVDWCAFLTGQ